MAIISSHDLNHPLYFAHYHHPPFSYLIPRYVDRSSFHPFLYLYLYTPSPIIYSMPLQHHYTVHQIKPVIKGFAHLCDRHVGSRLRLGKRRWRPLDETEANHTRTRETDTVFGWMAQVDCAKGWQIVKRDTDYVTPAVIINYHRR